MAEPRVAPYESCISCFKGDVTTGVCFKGDAEWVIACLHNFAGLPFDQASATLGLYAQEELGCDPGKVPAGRVTYCIRLCRDCGSRAGVELSEIAGGKFTAYVQPEELRRDDN